MIATLALLLPALVLAVPVGVGAGVYFHELAPRAGWVPGLGVVLAGLSEASPLLAGLALLATGLPVGPAASLALVLVLVPRVQRATARCLAGVDPRLRTAAEALGASGWEALSTLVLPQIRRPLSGRLLRETVRAAGEAAPLLLLSAAEPLAARAATSPSIAGMLVLAVLAANVVSLRLGRSP